MKPHLRHRLPPTYPPFSRRSGKSSIINVVLYKLPPTETVFIPTTIVIKKHTLQFVLLSPGIVPGGQLTGWRSSFRNFQVWDLPGQIDFLETNFDTDSIFSSAGAMVWVLDAQDDYLESVSRLTEVILQLQQVYPDIKFSVFIHKVDSLSSDFREDTVRDIKERILDDLNDAGLENPPVSFYPTSVYDDSIYEALSKVLQLLNPQLATFEALLNTVAAACKMKKLYLFDVLSKLYVASDTSPVDMNSYSLCSDYIDTIVDLSEIYGWDRGRLENGDAENGDGPAPPEDGEEQQQQQPSEGSHLQGAPSEAEVDDSGALQRNDEGSAESFISGVRGYCLYLKEMNKFVARVHLCHPS